MPEASPSPNASELVPITVAASLDAASCPELLPVITSPASPTTAGFRQLAHRITALSDVRSIAVTSPRRAEGKTSCALNLAAALAEQGQHSVLLVEANLHQPTLAAWLRFIPPECVARQMLRARAGKPQDWLGVAACYPNLHLLAVDPEDSPPGDSNPGALAGSLRQLGGRGYRFLIVDCPSVLDCSDVNVIQDCVDAVLLTARRGKSRRSLLRRAAESLQPARILGTVLLEY